jgi:hypothetical protein
MGIFAIPTSVIRAGTGRDAQRRPGFWGFPDPGIY